MEFSLLVSGHVWKWKGWAAHQNLGEDPSSSKGRYFTGKTTVDGDIGYVNCGGWWQVIFDQFDTDVDPEFESIHELKSRRCQYICSQGRCRRPDSSALGREKSPVYRSFYALESFYSFQALERKETYIDPPTWLEINQSFIRSIFQKTW